MLARSHPHAWDINHANQHLPADFRRLHLPKGGQLVVTQQMQRLAAGMPTALDRGAAVAVSGPYGAGKSTLLEAVAAVADVNTAFVVIPSRASEAAQWAVITKALTGTEPRGTARALQNHAREYLTAVPTLLIVDEAQFLSRSALLQLRWLWSHRFPRFAIVLAGSDLDEHLDAEPSVATRIDRRIHLRHHSRADMTGLVQRHHAAAAATDQEVLGFIDDVFAHGSWRLWSKVLLTLANDMQHTGPITPKDAQDAIEVVSGIRPALTIPLATRRQPLPPTRSGVPTGLPPSQKTPAGTVRSGVR